MSNITYLFVAYKNADFVLHTIDKLGNQGVKFYVHVDANSCENFNCLENNPNVRLATERYSCEWGKGGIVYAIISSIKAILNTWETDYIILMSEPTIL